MAQLWPRGKWPADHLLASALREEAVSHTVRLVVRQESRLGRRRVVALEGGVVDLSVNVDLLVVLVGAPGGIVAELQPRELLGAHLDARRVATSPAFVGARACLFMNAQQQSMPREDLRWRGLSHLFVRTGPR